MLPETTLTVQSVLTITSLPTLNDPEATAVIVPALGAGAALVHVVPLDVRTLPLVLGATACNAPVPFPSRTLLAVNDVAPVPPLATPRVPPKDTAPVVLVDGVNPVDPALNDVTPAVTFTDATHCEPS